jgi:hypothetical protein
MHTNPTTITVNPDLFAYIDPLTRTSTARTERSLLSEVPRRVGAVGRDVLVDGHKSMAFAPSMAHCIQNDSERDLKSMDDVFVDDRPALAQRLGLSARVLALRKKDILATVSNPWPPEGRSRSRTQTSNKRHRRHGGALTREATARVGRVSSATIVQIQKIQASATL